MSDRVMEIPELAGLEVQLADGTWVRFTDPDEIPVRPKPGPPNSPIHVRQDRMP